MKLNRILAAVLLIAGILAVGELAWLIHDLRSSQKTLVISAKQTIDDLDATVLVARGAVVNASMTLGRIEEASARWAQASVKQAKYWEQLQGKTLTTFDKLNEAADSLSALLKNTDKSLNTDLLPNLSGATDKFSLSIETLDKTLQEASERANLGLDDINRILADPSWAASQQEIQGVLENIRSLTSDIDTATDKLPAIAADLEKISKTSSKFAKPLLIARIVSLLSWLAPWLF